MLRRVLIKFIVNWNQENIVFAANPEDLTKYLDEKDNNHILEHFVFIKTGFLYYSEWRGSKWI